jgi:hypothetical protein
MQTYTYWRYFLALEEDLKNLSRYIEFCQDNYSVFSVELTRTYLAVCSEIDVIAKLLSKNLGQTNASNIINYKNSILGTYPNLPSLVINIPTYNLNFSPWISWREDNSPTWWKNYNNVKHSRNEFYKEANLDNVLNAMAGLLVINLYYLKQLRLSRQDDTDIFLDYEMRPIILIPDNFHRIPLVSGFLGWGGNLP